MLNDFLDFLYDFPFWLDHISYIAAYICDIVHRYLEVLVLDRRLQILTAENSGNREFLRRLHMAAVWLSLPLQPIQIILSSFLWDEFYWQGSWAVWRALLAANAAKNVLFLSALVMMGVRTWKTFASVLARLPYSKDPGQVALRTSLRRAQVLLVAAVEIDVFFFLFGIAVFQTDASYFDDTGPVLRWNTTVSALEGLHVAMDVIAMVVALSTFQGMELRFDVGLLENAHSLTSESSGYPDSMPEVGELRKDVVLEGRIAAALRDHEAILGTVHVERLSDANVLRYEGVHAVFAAAAHAVRIFDHDVPRQMTESLRATLQKEYRAEVASTSEALRRLQGLFGTELVRETCTKMMPLLTEPGDLLEVVLCDQRQAELRVSSLDGGCFKACFCRFGRSLHDSFDAVASLVRAFRAKTASDRWEPWLVERLATDLECSLEESYELRGLLGQPKTGALVVSLDGIVLAAAVKLRHCDVAGTVRFSNGLAAPLQCAGALGVAQDFGEAWRSGDAPGVAAVCSDTFGCCLMLPQLGAAPQLLQISFTGCLMYYESCELRAND